MEIIDHKERNVKRSIISKMRIPSSVLERIAKVGGKVGEAAATIDSWQSRVFDKGRGVYNTKDWEK